METDEIALALDDDALEVIVKNSTRDAAEVLEGSDVTASEALECLVESKPSECRARPSQDHHETGQSALPAARPQLSKGAPIDLGLLTGQHGQTKEGLVTRSGSHLPDVPPNGVDAARVAAVAQHFEQS